MALLYHLQPPVVALVYIPGRLVQEVPQAVVGAIHRIAGDLGQVFSLTLPEQSILYLAGNNDDANVSIGNERGGKEGFDQFAFRATGYQEMRENFARHNLCFQERSVPHLNEHQMFAHSSVEKSQLYG